ncbi:hypothetical protein, partial [Aeromicrobium sp.]|uniref:hypothetical protein n=1 Tax=Aeromicrobium sp. TaxID=1871063 RepID=UPI003C495626
APGIIDDEDLVRVIERECRTMTTSVESTSLAGSPSEQLGAIRKQNRAVSRMVAMIEQGHGQAISKDRPTRLWLDDWRTIVDARNTFVQELVDDSGATFDVPLDPEGVPIDVRMQKVWLGDSSCSVPSALLNPYPGVPVGA